MNKFGQNRYSAHAATYNCELCGKRTRDTGNGEGENAQCRRCFQVNACLNTLSDGGVNGASKADFEGANTHKQIIARMGKIAASQNIELF